MKHSKYHNDGNIITAANWNGSRAGRPALQTSTKQQSIPKCRETVSSQINISEQLLLSNCSNPYLTSAGQVFLVSLHDPFTEHHTPSSQASLRLVGDTLHMAILVPLSVEELHQVFKQLKNPTTISNCFPNPEQTPVIWKIVFGGVRYMTGLPTDTQAAWPHFTRLPGNSLGQVSHGLTHLTATQPLGQLRLHWQKKTHPLLIEYFVARLLLTDFHVHVLAVFI